MQAVGIIIHLLPYLEQTVLGHWDVEGLGAVKLVEKYLQNQRLAP